MHARIHRQQGMTAIGVLLVLAILGVFVLVILRLTPAYLESFRVRGQLSSLSEDAKVDGKSPTQIRQMLKRRFSIDDIDNVADDQIKIVKGKGMVEIDIKYEVRMPILGNIDAVTMFEMHEEFRAR